MRPVAQFTNMVYNVGIAIIWIRWFHDRLIFIMEIPAPGKTAFIENQGPEACILVSSATTRVGGMDVIFSNLGYISMAWCSILVTLVH